MTRQPRLTVAADPDSDSGKQSSDGFIGPKLSFPPNSSRPSVNLQSAVVAPSLRSHHRLHPSLLQICPGLERMGENGLAASADVWFWLSGRVETDLTDTYNGFLQPWVAPRHHSRHILGANRHALSSHRQLTNSSDNNIGSLGS